MSGEYKMFEEVEDYYVDQAMFGIRHVGFSMGSTFTSYGIKCIDSEYCILIQQIDRPILKAYEFERRRAQFSDVKTRKVDTTYGHYEFYDPIEISKIENTCEPVIVWENRERKFTYINEIKVVDNMIDVKWLTKSIKNNKHLHVKIKENLLGNIASR